MELPRWAEGDPNPPDREPLPGWTRTRCRGDMRRAGARNITPTLYPPTPGVWAMRPGNESRVFRGPIPRWPGTHVTKARHGIS